jgi:hypothetical protein
MSIEDAEYNEFINARDKALLESVSEAESLDKWLLSLSSSGVALCAGLAFLDGANEIPIVLLIAAGGFVAAIVVSIFKKLNSAKCAEQYRDRIDQVYTNNKSDFRNALYESEYKNRDAYNSSDLKRTRCASYIFIASIILLALSPLSRCERIAANDKIGKASAQTSLPSPEKSP